jgi:hypothetical protein
MARRIRKLAGHPDKKYVRNFLGNIITFQEEVGTGGGGFRFMYAAFLREASVMLDRPELLDASRRMVEVGDLWRQAALSCAKLFRDRQPDYDTAPIADAFQRCAEAEREVYLLMKKIKWR